MEMASAHIWRSVKALRLGPSLMRRGLGRGMQHGKIQERYKMQDTVQAVASQSTVRQSSDSDYRETCVTEHLRRLQGKAAAPQFLNSSTCRCPLHDRTCTAAHAAQRNSSSRSRSGGQLACTLKRPTTPVTRFRFHTCRAGIREGC